MMRFDGRRVLITGGAIRVGAVLVRAFAAAGASVVIHCRNSRKEADALCREIGGAERGHSVVCGDLTQPGMPEKILADAAPVDILVNNASGYVCKPFLEETDSEVRAMLNVNFLAPLSLMKAFAANLAPQRGDLDPCIVNLTDQAVTGAAPDSFGYLVSKKALAAATESAALALAPHIRVNAVAPGPVMAPERLKHLNMASTLKRVPLGRAVSVDDVAETVLMLAENRSMTGAVVFVDGGQHLFETHHPSNPKGVL